MEITKITKIIKDIVDIIATFIPILVHLNSDYCSSIFSCRKGRFKEYGYINFDRNLELEGARIIFAIIISSVMTIYLEVSNAAQYTPSINIFALITSIIAFYVAIIIFHYVQYKINLRMILQNRKKLLVNILIDLALLLFAFSVNIMSISSDGITVNILIAVLVFLIGYLQIGLNDKYVKLYKNEITFKLVDNDKEIKTNYPYTKDDVFYKILISNDDGNREYISILISSIKSINQRIIRIDSNTEEVIGDRPHRVD